MTNRSQDKKRTGMTDKFTSEDKKRTGMTDKFTSHDKKTTRFAAGS